MIDALICNIANTSDQANTLLTLGLEQPWVLTFNTKLPHHVAVQDPSKKNILKKHAWLSADVLNCVPPSSCQSPATRISYTLSNHQIIRSARINYGNRRFSIDQLMVAVRHPTCIGHVLIGLLTSSAAPSPFFAQSDCRVRPKAPLWVISFCVRRILTLFSMIKRRIREVARNLFLLLPVRNQLGYRLQGPLYRSCIRAKDRIRARMVPVPTQEGDANHFHITQRH